MFVVTPYPNILYALDLTKPGAPLKWKHEPKPLAAAQGVACCDIVNRGAAYADGRVFFNTLDGQTIALDAGTGAELWRTQLGDINLGETITMAPLVVQGKVLVGNSGGEMGVRGWIAALDAEDGSLAWRAYSTGPDRDVLIGERFQPFYAQDRGTDLGVASWPPDAWRIGGGTVWGWLTYDPEVNLLYYGTGNPGPWNPEQRPGDNKWTAGIFARDPDTGEAVWFYQWSPHDLHDYDGVNENILIDLEWQGTPRKVLVHPERNGYVYLMDRLTGEVLYARPFAHITTSKGVDLETGRLIYNPEKAGAGRPGHARDLPGLAGRQGLAAVGLLAADRAPLHPAQQPLPGRRADADQLHRRHALRRDGGAHVRRAGRPSRRAHRLGRRRRARGLDASRRTSRSGAAPRRPRATSCSTARWTAGSKRCTRRPASCSGASRSAPASSASRRSTAAPTASSTSPSSPASAAGRARSSRAASIRATAPRRSGFVNAMTDLPQHTGKGGMLYVFALP